VSPWSMVFAVMRYVVCHVCKKYTRSPLLRCRLKAVEGFAIAARDQSSIQKFIRHVTASSFNEPLGVTHAFVCRRAGWEEVDTLEAPSLRRRRFLPTPTPNPPCGAHRWLWLGGNARAVCPHTGEETEAPRVRARDPSCVFHQHRRPPYSVSPCAQHTRGV
jgi:hypothetical protein